MKHFPSLHLYIIMAIVLLTGHALCQERLSGDPGLASITSHEVSAHMTFLASDMLEGREAGKPGVDMAAAYIAAQFQDAGLFPLGDPQSYFQSFELIYRSPEGENFVELLTSRSGASITRRLEMDDGFIPLYFSDNQKVTAPVAFVGFGISAPEYNYDDYQKIDVRGKAVLMFRHEPREKDSTSAFNGTSFTKYAQFDEKARIAQKNGAVAMLLVNDMANHEVDRIPGYMKRWPKLTEEVVGIPCVWITEVAANHLLSGSGKTVRELHAAIDKDFRSKSMALPGQTVTVQTALNSKDVTVKNVVGLLKGETDETVVVGAHYDHVGKEGDDVYNGADDNASGTVGLLEVAEAFTHSGRLPRRSLLFIAFTAEEKGLIGADYYVEHPLVPLEKTTAMINMDMVGRNEDTASMSERARRGFRMATAEESKNIIYAIGTSRSGDMRIYSDRANQQVGFDILYDYDNAQSLITRSDQYKFIQKGIPALFFSTGAHPDYHKPSDTADKIDIDKMTRVLKLVYLTTQALADDPARPFLDEPLSTH